MKGWKLNGRTKDEMEIVRRRMKRKRRSLAKGTCGSWEEETARERDKWRRKRDGRPRASKVVR